MNLSSCLHVLPTLSFSFALRDSHLWCGWAWACEKARRCCWSPLQWTLRFAGLRSWSFLYLPVRPRHNQPVLSVWPLATRQREEKKKKKRKHIFNIIKEICLNNFSSSHVESIQWLTCDLKSHSSPLGSSWPLWLLCWVSAQCKPVSGRLELPGHVEGFSSLLFYGRASLTACALLLMWLTWWGGRGNHTQTTCEKHSETVCTNF